MDPCCSTPRCSEVDGTTAHWRQTTSLVPGPAIPSLDVNQETGPFTSTCRHVPALYWVTRLKAVREWAPKRWSGRTGECPPQWKGTDCWHNRPSQGQKWLHLRHSPGDHAGGQWPRREGGRPQKDGMLVVLWVTACPRGHTLVPVSGSQ